MSQGLEAWGAEGLEEQLNEKEAELDQCNRRYQELHRRAQALDLLLTGRTFYAEEALELGLVKEVVAPDELLARVLAYADDMARNCAPSALAVIKRQVYDDALRDMVATSAQAEKLMHESMQRPDFIEGITAFFEKRPPNFPPLEEDKP